MFRPSGMYLGRNRMRKSMVFLASGLVAALEMAAGVHGEPTADKEAGRVRPAPGGREAG